MYVFFSCSNSPSSLFIYKKKKKKTTGYFREAKKGEKQLILVPVYLRGLTYEGNKNNKKKFISFRTSEGGKNWGNSLQARLPKEKKKHAFNTPARFFFSELHATGFEVRSKKSTGYPHFPLNKNHFLRHFSLLLAIKRINVDNQIIFYHQN